MSLGPAALVLAGTLAPAPPAAAQPEAAASACDTRFFVEELRAASRGGSPAYLRYLRRLLRETARAAPLDHLPAAFASERDPVVVETLGVAMVARADLAGERPLLAAVVARARRDPDPRLRAAAVRSLRGTASVSLLRRFGQEGYGPFIADPSAEVRAAAAENLVTENELMYHLDPLAAEEAVMAAAQAHDAALAARILGTTSLETVGSDAVAAAVRLLDASAPGLRVAAAAALGTAAAGHSADVVRALERRFRREPDAAVRTALAGALMRLGRRPPARP